MKQRTRLIALVVIVGFIIGVSIADDLLIQVSPQRLVLSSVDGKLTIHTNTPFLKSGNDGKIWIDDAEIEKVWVFADNQGNLVAQCSKASAKAVIPMFTGKTKSVVVTLEANGKTGSQRIIVQK